ncbi:MAG: PQQ-binding-like beta-propeller repeat protein [Pseudomonadota bacterium]
MKRKYIVIAIAVQAAFTALIIAGYLLTRSPEAAETRTDAYPSAPETAPGAGAAETAAGIPTPQAVYRGNNARTGQFPATLAAGSHGIRWQMQVSTEKTSPIVYQGTLFFGSGDGVLVAAEAAPARELWNRMSYLRSPATVSPEGKVYVSTAEAIETYDARTGEPQVPFSDSAGSEVVVDEGSVYMANASGLHKLDGSGNQIWGFNAGDVGSASSPAIEGDTVYFVTRDRKPEDASLTLFAVDAASGEERWRFTTDGFYSRGAQVPAVAGGIVYFSSSSMEVPERDVPYYEPVSRGRLHAIDAQSGAELWGYDLPQSVRPLAVADGSVFVAYDNRGPDGMTAGYLRALDARTGAERWAVERGAVLSPPSVSGGEVIAVTAASAPYNDIGEQCRLSAFDAASGEERWSVALPSDSYLNELFISDGAVYLASPVYLISIT